MAYPSVKSRVHELIVPCVNSIPRGINSGVGLSPSLIAGNHLVLELLCYIATWFCVFQFERSCIGGPRVD